MVNNSEKAAGLSSQRLLGALEEARVKLEAVERAKTEPVAIIGMGCRFPGGADNPEAFWRLLREEVDAITEVPANRWDIDAYFDSAPDTPGKMYTRFGGFINQLAEFDPHFFGISPRETVSLDPQQRLLLEVSWEALENAALVPERLAGSKTGVFVGICGNDYFQLLLARENTEIDVYLATGNAYSVASGRLSYILGLKGPSLSVDTACSSSLVSVHLACQSLRNKESNLALAGGVNMLIAPERSLFLSKARMLSPDGRCKTFDATADGFVRSEGCGVIVLKRLSDAIADGNNILAVIRGSAINQDGRTSGLTVPNGQSQQAVIRQALENSGVKPAQVSYVEAHGTGTTLGDPIEVEALGSVFSKGRTKDQPLIIGSVKTNIGHLEAAAGVAGLIKVVLSLQHQEIPAHLHFKQPNPHLNWDKLPLPVIVPTEQMPWLSKERRIAAVSSFGFSGTNAHVVLEEAPSKGSGGVVEASNLTRPLHLLTLSAKSKQALTQLAQRYQELLTNPEISLPDVCFTANTGRSHFDHHLCVVAASSAQMCEQLAAFTTGQEATGVFLGQMPNTKPKIAFLFTGQGSQYVGIGRQLYDTQLTFRQILDRCDQILRPDLEKPLLEVLYGTTTKIDQTAYAQPALFALEYALAQLWKSWGIEPAIVFGQDVGEYVAACVAGVFSLEDGLRLVTQRGLMQAMSQKQEKELMLDAFAQTALQISFQAPRIPMISSLTGQMLSVPDANYWRHHIQEPVEFTAGMNTLQEQGYKLFLELGPQPTFSNLGSFQQENATWLPSLMHGEDDWQVLLKSLSTLYLQGANINWIGFDQNYLRHLLSLPTYPFQQKHYWFKEQNMDAKSGAKAFDPQADALSKTKRWDEILLTLRSLVANLLQVAPSEVEVHASFLEMGADSLILVDAVRNIENTYGIKITIRQLFEELTSVNALALYIDQNLAAESNANSRQPEPVETLQVEATRAITLAEPSSSDNTQNGKGTGTAPETVLEGIIKQQLQVMSQQLETLRSNGLSDRNLFFSENGRSQSPTVPTVHFPQTQQHQVATKLESEQVPPSFLPPRLTETKSRELNSQQQRHLETLIARYTRRTQKSKQRAQTYRPVLADSRSVAGFRPSTKEMLYPIIGERSQGSRFWDIDGNEYVDISMGFGVLLFGHAPPFVSQALEEQIKQGIQIGPQSSLAGEVAQLICELTGMERVSFCNSGTEAVMTALRLARTATNRTKIALFADSYHGHFDGVLATALNGHASVPMASGVSPNAVADVLVLDYGNPKSLDILQAHAQELAAVIVEPVQSRRPDLQPKEFLQQLRQLTAAAGTALIFDEVLIGFRIHPGGAQAWFGVEADIAIYGKIIGGGMPIGVVAGKAMYMNAIDGGRWNYGDASYPQAEKTFFAGTFNKNHTGMAAARAVLKHLKEQGSALQQQLNQRTSGLVTTLNTYFESENVPMRIVQFGSLFRFAFSGNMDLLFYHLIEKGVYIWEGRNCFLSTAHTDTDINYLIQAVKESVEELRSGGFLPKQNLPLKKLLSKAVSTLGRSSLVDAATPNLAKLDAPEIAVNQDSNGKLCTKLDMTTLVVDGVSCCINCEIDADAVLGLPQLVSRHSEDQQNNSHHAPLCELTLRSPAEVNPDVTDVISLTQAQKQLLLLAQIEDEASSAYNESIVIRLQGSLNLSAMRKAFQQVVNRHEALRTVINSDKQQILPILTIDVPVTDFSNLEITECETQVAQWLKQASQQGFDLMGVLLRINILKLEEQQHLLVFTAHHIIVDGWSIALILQEVGTFYAAECQGIVCQQEPPLQFREYVRWQEEQSVEIAKHEAYWLKQFESIPILELPTDRPRPPVKTYKGARAALKLEADCTKIKEFSRQKGCTLFMTLLAGYMTLLHRLTNQDDIAIGVPVAGRTLSGSEKMVGYGAHLLPIRSHLVDSSTFSEYLNSIRHTLLDAYEHQDYSFAKLIDLLNPPRDASRSAIVTATFNLDRPLAVPQMLALDLELVSSAVSYAKFDISLNAIEIDDQLLLEVDYNTDLFNADTIARLLEHFQTLLANIVADPEQRVGDLPLLNAAQQHEILVEWNSTQTDYPQDKCIQQLFEAQVEQTPDQVAVVFQDQQLTYRELNNRANQLAHYLKSLGVEPDVLVGLCVERSLEMVVGILGILKAGGAYVPLDPAYPAERLTYILEDTKAPLLLTQQVIAANLPKHHTCVCLDSEWEIIGQLSADNLLESATSTNLAYIIYTSGSTGKPKGVAIHHQGIVNRLLWGIERYQISPADCVSLKTSFSFDVSVKEIFEPLLAGARLIITRPDSYQDPAYLAQVMAEQRVTIAGFVPSMLQIILEELESCPTLRYVTCGGEALPTRLRDYFFSRLGAVELHNHFGPTEVSIDATCWVCDRHSSINPIGRPIANMQVYILDAHLQPVAIGVPGELYIGGAGLARGYLNRPDLTAEKFVPHPFSKVPGDRLYKTGDLACFLADGNIEFLGRIDNQVKIRGLRIELGEIEAGLNQHPGVQQTVIMVREDLPDQQCLVAYLVPDQEKTITSSGLRSFLKQRLPEYMIPSAFVLLPVLPLNPNGKVDRLALPAPERFKPDLEEIFVAPCNSVERMLVEIWSDVLGLKRISIHDNFFELGGDSILSIQIVAKANRSGLSLTAKQFFQYQTIASLATVVGTTKENQIAQSLVTGSVRLTPIQQWFFQQELPEPHHWNQAILLEVHQTLDLSLLSQVVQRLLVHHDALRLRFTRSTSGWQQINAVPDSSSCCTRVDLSALSAAEQRQAIEVKTAQLQTSLNLESGPLVRVAVFDLGANQRCRLLLLVHHLLVDGVSWRILLEDLQTGYQQLGRGQEISLPPKTTSFQDWSQRLTEYAQSKALEAEMAYWLAQSQKQARLPIDYPEGNNTEASARTVSVALSATETHALLQEVPKAYHTQINAVLLTALVQTFTQWTHTRCLLIDLEGHGREEIFADIDLSRTVGWFTTVFPVELDLGEVTDLGEALKSVKEQLRRIPNRGIGYGILRYLKEDTKLQALPQAEVSFNYLGQFDQVLSPDSNFRLAKESSRAERSYLGSRSHLLEIDGLLSEGQLQINWTYSEAVHQRTTIENLAQGFIAALESLITHCQSSEATGYTPSDFPNMEFSQDELDELITELSETVEN